MQQLPAFTLYMDDLPLSQAINAIKIRIENQSPGISEVPMALDGYRILILINIGSYSGGAMSDS